MQKFICVYSITSILLLIFCVQQTLSIICWHCNSLNDPFCSDPFDNTTANKKDCRYEPELPHLRGVPASMCRKIRMKINGQWRFKRDCARLGEPGVGGDERYCIYRSGTYNIHMEYCTCDDKDGCNMAHSQYQVSYLIGLGFPLLFTGLVLQHCL